MIRSTRIQNPLPLRSGKEAVVWAVSLLAALVSVVTTFGIVAVLAVEALAFFRHVSLVEFFTGRVWSPIIKPAQFGILPLVVGTLHITFGAVLVAGPLGLLTAIYLSEYASPRFRSALKPVLEILAGIPTVVYGYFAVYFVTPALKGVFPSIAFYNAMSGAIVVGIMVLPLITSLCEDALAAVPRSLREGAYAVGSTKMEVSLKIVTPAALSGIVAAFILAISRAVGETMAVTLAAGATPNLTLNPLESIQTMTAYIVQISKGDTPAGSVEYQTIFAVGAMLFTITFILNLLAVRFVKRFRTVYH